MKEERINKVDLSDFLDSQVFPALYDRLDLAFGEFKWTRKGDKWTATDETFTRSLPGSPRPDRVYCYQNSPFCFVIQGGERVSWIKYLEKPYPEAVRDLAERAGVPFPEGAYSPEQVEKWERKDRTAALLETVFSLAQEYLSSENGENARKYLKDRGIPEERLPEFGLVPDPETLRKAIKEEDSETAKKLGLFLPKWPGRIIGAWRDSSGRIINFWGRHYRETPEGQNKYEGLSRLSSDEPFGGKDTPFNLDLAFRLKKKDLLLVEGPLKALVPYFLGLEEPLPIAAGGTPSKKQIETLGRYLKDGGSLTLCLDYDPKTYGKKEDPTLQTLRNLSGVDFPVYVIDPVEMVVNGNLSDKEDPDSFILKEEIGAFRELCKRRTSPPLFHGGLIFRDITPESPDLEKGEALRKTEKYIKEYLRGPWAKLEGEKLSLLAVEKTGYSPEAIEDISKAAEEAGRREEAKKRTEAAVREAQRDLLKEKDPFEVTRKLREKTASIEAQEVEPPPPFSVDRIQEKLRDLPEGKLSGWKTLDKDLEVRFSPGELTAIASRPSHGKTSVLTCLLNNWLETSEEEDFFLFYSFEEPEERLVTRLVSGLTVKRSETNGWGANEVRDFQRGEDSRGEYYEWPETNTLDNAWKTLREKENRLQIVFCPSWTVEQVEAHAQGIASRRKVSAVLLDYLQKITPSRKQDRRDIEVSIIARHLKALAVSLNCPVITGAQIGRPEKKEPIQGDYKSITVQDKLKKRRFTMQDLREGGIEQEVDLALGLLNYRVDFHEGQEDKTQEEQVPDPSRLEIGVLKYRYGEVGKWAPMAWRRKFAFLRDPDFWRNEDL